MQHERIDKFHRSTFDDWTPLQRMRLSELRRICDAYEIPYSRDYKQRDLLPIVQRAKNDGVFTPGPTFVSDAKKPWFLTGELPPDENPPALAVVETDISGATVEHMGMKRKYCVVDGDNIIKSGFKSKQEAEEWLSLSLQQ